MPSFYHQNQPWDRVFLTRSRPGVHIIAEYDRDHEAEILRWRLHVCYRDCCSSNVSWAVLNGSLSVTLISPSVHVTHRVDCVVWVSVPMAHPPFSAFEGEHVEGGCKARILSADQVDEIGRAGPIWLQPSNRRSSRAAFPASCPFGRWGTPDEVGPADCSCVAGCRRCMRRTA